MMLKFTSFLLPLFSFFFPTASASDSTLSSTVSATYSCAHGLQIGYPFWLSHGSIPDQCHGYREVGHICDDGYPFYTSPPGLNADYDSHSLHLVDFATFYQTCPRALHKVPLGNLLLPRFCLNLKLRSYDISSSHPSYASPPTCFSSVVGNQTGDFDWSGNSEESVTQINLKGHVTSEGLMNEHKGEAMNEGFVLECSFSVMGNEIKGFDCSRNSEESVTKINLKGHSTSEGLMNEHKGEAMNEGFGPECSFSSVRDENKDFGWSGDSDESISESLMNEYEEEAMEMNDYDDEVSEMNPYEEEEAMNEVFVLDRQRVCDECEDSDGSCLYSETKKEFLCLCKDGSVQRNGCSGRRRVLLSKLIIGLIAAGVGALLICIIIFFSRRRISLMISVYFQKMKKNDEAIESFIRNNGPLTIERYTFSEIKKMTNSFEVKLGEGGYGTVFKGSTLNSCPVAVKVLKASKENGEEFINELVSISRTSHVNIVTLLGFCLEGRQKALVYELMPNGSLDKFICKRDLEPNHPSLSWEKLLQIAKGIAKGLQYLHSGCNTRILHFDIKPNNILLDKNFCPKISDFGLAKLCSKTHSIVSMCGARGTVGYIAPEMWNRSFGRVSHKSDVYSFGMLILKMVGGRQNINTEVSDSSDKYFPHLVYKQILLDENTKEHDDVTREESEIAKKMMMVGLWCVQTMPSDRPSMNRVIEMLEGSLEQISIPPKSSIFSPITARNQEESCAPNGVLSFSADYQSGR